MLTMGQKKAVTRELQDRYRKCSRKEKTVLLNEFIQLTGYNRSYAGRVLRRKEILGYLTIFGKRVKYVAADRKRKKKRFYDEEVLVALKELWEEADSICSRRLDHFLAEFIPVLEKYREIKPPIILHCFPFSLTLLSQRI